MQSRLAETGRRSLWLLSSAHRSTLQQGLCSASGSQTTDPAIHSGERAAGPAVHRGEPQDTTTNNAKNFKFAETDNIPSKQNEPFKSPNPPNKSSPELKSTGVNERLDPNFQQKRNQGTVALENVNCAGLDGTPWPNDRNREENNRKEEAEDDRDYFKHHKASPLSGLEFVDSRKQITRATDGTADSGMGRNVIGWRPEQLDTAEEALRRATEIWRQNAMRGDPDSPHGKVLRALRGEDF